VVNRLRLDANLFAFHRQNSKAGADLRSRARDRGSSPLSQGSQNPQAALPHQPLVRPNWLVEITASAQFEAHHSRWRQLPPAPAAPITAPPA